MPPLVPPLLTAAYDQFKAWSQERLAEEQTRGTPTQPLYHYTPGETGLAEFSQ